MQEIMIQQLHRRQQLQPIDEEEQEEGESEDEDLDEEIDEHVVWCQLVACVLLLSVPFFQVLILYYLFSE